MTTAIYPNRIKDKEQLESKYALPEDGSSTISLSTSVGTVLTTGYRRIVYGDHGPYIEFSTDQIQTTFRNKFPFTKKDAYYCWMVPTDGSQVKIYYQLRTVANLKNPPEGGFNGNRSEGYADYKVGMYYVSPYDPNLKICIT